MKNIKEVRLLISVGVDVSKGKSTVCILKPYGEVIMSPNDYEHTLSDLKKLADQMDSFEDEIHVTMEATGNYHFPIATYLKKRDYDVRIINPLEMKRYRCQGIRNPKTDNIDAFMIAQYGIDFWFRPFQDYVVGCSMDEDFICFERKDGLFYSREFDALILSSHVFSDLNEEAECIKRIIDDINK